MWLLVIEIKKLVHNIVNLEMIKLFFFFFLFKIYPCYKKHQVIGSEQITLNKNTYIHSVSLTLQIIKFAQYNCCLRGNVTEQLNTYNQILTIIYNYLIQGINCQKNIKQCTDFQIKHERMDFHVNHRILNCCLMEIMNLNNIFMCSGMSDFVHVKCILFTYVYK